MNQKTLVVALLGCTLSLNAAADRGIYLGAAVGAATLDDSFAGFEIDDTNTAYRLTGGWRFNAHIGLELGWQDFGDFEQRGELNGTPVVVRLGADGYTLGATGRYPLGRGFELQARVGAFFWDGEAEINATAEADPSHANVYLGAGVGYKVSQRLRITADWSRYDLEDSATGVWSLGLEFGF